MTRTPYPNLRPRPDLHLAGLSRTPHTPTAAQERASLHGLDVQDSDFMAWVEAGGELPESPPEPTR
ncbi:hypothetical protein HNQ51_000836 [Inhella inkyongensis]|uniref:Uncharacterized protein n=1 Tax=Inhella inkyongensis TaxID=392593 RepID=A0A840S1A5_9BURK|nr:hypothetical protein [Inhella inkyongensis]MBB5203543.1 hypothetical protein [Inhella inkyongensis]